MATRTSSRTKPSTRTVKTKRNGVGTFKTVNVKGHRNKLNPFRKK